MAIIVMEQIISIVNYYNIDATQNVIETFARTENEIENRIAEKLTLTAYITHAITFSQTHKNFIYPFYRAFDSNDWFETV